ncbi:hypothetical protein [Bacillus cereus]|uniref:hypothetical protein n=1 Tax=Bacillus cereus TaxID=1396 RepID=UPI0018F44418|nr:hypothetical protein [Bacillus cereus]MBJ8009218.1 hypothetical protein [Bacillus cereus]
MRELLSNPATATLSANPENEIGVMPNLKAIINKLENSTDNINTTSNPKKESNDNIVFPE